MRSRPAAGALKDVKGEHPASTAAQDSRSLEVASPYPEPELQAPAAVDEAFSYSVKIQEIGPGVYEVSAADAQSLLNVAGRLLPTVARGIRPAFSFDEGLQYRIRSEFIGGVLTREGFTATDPKLVAQAGIEAGDIILSVNGRPVDGLTSSYAIFVKLLPDPGQRAIEVELEREGERLTKTYRFR